MTILQAIVTYVTCWWLVLFMVLPYKADAPANPGAGHVPSAPANPMIKKKLKWATIFAIIPTVLIYFAVNNIARADDNILSTKTKCNSVNHHARADVAAVDGYSTGGKKVKPANLEPESAIGNHVEIPLEIPVKDYTQPGAHNVNLDHSFAEMGTIAINKDGTSYLNDQPIAPKESVLDGCE